MISRKLLIALAASTAVGFALPTFAGYANCSCSGVYIGGQLGWGQVDHKHRHHWSEEISGFDHSHHNNNEDGLAGRAYLGYQFNQYIGLETGFAGFSTDDPSYGHDHDRQEHHHHHSDGWKVRTTQWDLLARLGSPFGDSGWRGDVKLGAAGVFIDNDDHFHIHDRQESHHGHDNTQWGPAAGASLTYNFNRCVAMDLSYLHVFGDLDHHHHHDDVNDYHYTNESNTDLVTIGVSYLFLM